MEAAQVDLVKAAAIKLITAANSHELHEALEAVTRLATRYPVKLSGDASVLNPLVALSVADPDKFKAVMEFIDRERLKRGFDAFMAPPKASAKENKVAYMREFMDQKRLRQRKALDIENMRRPEKDRLVGNARMEFMRRASLRWKDLRDEALARATPTGGTLTAKQRSDVLDRFWAAVDEDLEHKMAEARKYQLNPNRPTPDDGMGELMAALNLPPR